MAHLARTREYPELTKPRLLDTGYLVLLWLVMIVPLLALRPLWPMIETRYVSVAWEMWLRHDFLVPYLNGAPYSHKPPLLFWTIHAGWWLFGVNSWWPRVVPSLYVFGTLIMALRIGRLLWPDREEEIDLFLPFILFGSLLLTFYMTFVMFDLLVTFSGALGMYGLVYAVLRRRATGFLLFGLGLGLGILSKGPVILVFLLPVSLVAPWVFQGKTGQRWGTWYLCVFASFLLGALIALCWAVPAAYSGGEAYAQALFWKQTANRIVESFAHRQPWWWYLPLMPLLLFPWPWLPGLWREVRGLSFRDWGVRFCLAWFILPLILLSMISGKQVHYLLPLFPAFGLLGARLATGASFSRRDFIPHVILFGIFGGIWLALPFIKAASRLPFWVRELPPSAGVLIILLSLAFLVFVPRNRNQNIKSLTTLTVLLLVIIQAGILAAGSAPYDVKPLSAYLAKIQEQGYPVANAAKYDGQFQFVGRLKQPLEVISRDEVSEWLTGHPQGRVVQYFKQWPQGIGQKVEFVQPFRGQFAVVSSAL
jgi:4-amino-4-deoxy-L-arabinose transferase-like glycosyltransferase